MYLTSQSIHVFHQYVIGILSILLTMPLALAAEDEVSLEYSKDIAPLLTKYCAGCHNDAEPEADFSAESFAALQKGLEGGPIFLAEDPDGSKLIRLIEGTDEPVMPPEDEPRPTDVEIKILRAWIEQGAKGPEGQAPDRLALHVPEVAPYKSTSPVTALAIDADQLLAVGRFQRVELHKINNSRTEEAVASTESPVRVIDGIPGKIASLHFSKDGKRLAVGSGVAGKGGWCGIYDPHTGEQISVIEGHNDLLYDAEISPDGSVIATSSYDKDIIIWNSNDGSQQAVLSGHNGAVYDVAFSPNGEFLISASADDTCKVWRVSDGLRLDTLGQPLKESYSCSFSPDGRLITSVGADKKLRVWRFVSRKGPRINPQLNARFAHETAINLSAWLPNGQALITVAENNAVKLWDSRDFTESQAWRLPETDLISSLVVSDDGSRFYLGLLNGEVKSISIPELKSSASSDETDPSTELVAVIDREKQSLKESEPNNDPAKAHHIQLPAEISGVIDSGESEQEDVDLYRFTAKKGEEWVFEVNAARSKSKLDSFIEILNADGDKLLRKNLQAIRESYFTFRGKNSDIVGDFRLFNWQEMNLNEFLYANGEVVRFFYYPRGADSGFNVYPNFGKRFGYFDTTPLTHALGEPCYVVKPYEPDETIIPNGLPVFPIHYENDDSAHRDLGSDSRLFFTAPADGEYLLKIRDVRGQSSKDHHYKLIGRPRMPDFSVKVGGKISLAPERRREITLIATRTDGYEGPIEVTFNNVPEGIQIDSPVIIEEGQLRAYATIHLDKFQEEPAESPTPENSEDAKQGDEKNKDKKEKVKTKAELELEKLAAEITLTASAVIRNQPVAHTTKCFDSVDVTAEPTIEIEIMASPDGPQPISTGTDGPLEFEIHHGETIQLKVKIERNGIDGPIGFGKETAGRNLPFGVFVDNIGLNGLLVTAKNNEREFFITCDPVAQPQSRLFHLVVEGKDLKRKFASQSVLLHVRPKAKSVAERVTAGEKR
ncbi:c-type cytochrome domain-containing protein [Calycomorphotria hydatis]|uniref:WD domain, G-beta repeat n=1 Tax=Calycomorphotria hydatis TaxID=2528027 RepID=A0A517TB63_9PLAN|nr:c-type cytochrome domain-containing protein [Calycomorphotria hydatis]QDT65606.1 WD domain, G-beta repeat [Calycomorphotria hydatis]